MHDIYLLDALNMISHVRNFFSYQLETNNYESIEAIIVL